MTKSPADGEKNASQDIGEIDDTCKSVLSRYGRAILHMRQQRTINRFGLVLGAGASVGLGFPSWSNLVDRISRHSDVDGESMIRQAAGHTSRSQLLYQRYKTRRADGAGEKDHEYNRLEMTIRAGWQRIVHECLYDGVPKDITSIKKRDQFLWAFLNVMKDAPITVNYNFDDTIQRLLADARSEKERLEKRGYTTVWNSNIQINSRQGVIYHPNGYLPYNLTEKPSEHLIFLEDTFADQLIDSMAGHYASLSTHLAQTTCLLIGLSLNDATLKHLLRQNARAFPGHYHYYVAFAEKDEKLDADFREAASAANFEVYNLITLFLSAAEIAAVGKLLSLPDGRFEPLAEEQGLSIVQRFFLTGSVSVGKSTTVAHFRDLITHDEWTEERAPEMEKDPAFVGDPKQLKEIDDWVADQIGKKNVVLAGAGSGIHIIDRAPLDAFAFAKPSEWRDKAKNIRNFVTPGKAVKRALVPGHLILMIGDPEVMAVRAIARHKVTDASKLARQQALLQTVYGERKTGVTIVDTRDKSVYQVVKEIGAVIHQRDYIEGPMDEWLTEVQEGKIEGPPE